PGCTGTGISLNLFVERADGSNAGAGSAVSPCETVIYKGSLTGGVPTGTAVPCCFQGGTVTITTPDGVVHDVTPAGGVPLKCPLDVPTDTLSVQYQVRSQDVVNGRITARIDFTAAESFTGTPPSTGVPIGSTSVPNTVVPCPPGTPCLTSICDPTLQGTGVDAGRMGLCKTPGCEAGQCVQAHINVTDSTPCTDTDNNACTTAGCEGGVCIQTHVPPPTCANPVCQVCNPSTGQCENITPQPPECVQLLGCRVTGGGTVDACGPGNSGCDPSTPGSCAPDTCASPALNATHGGQVGAPIGVATPFTPDSACIAGEWTHVRHIRPRLFGNFHARSFDSLECACLPCPENPDAQGVVGALCNPGDRICGPEPRRAPANKICFSGPGNYALTNGKRAKRSVVFRVDVEDRSEPGGTNGPPPPDRYRMRIWFVDPDSSAGLDLRRAVAG